MIKQRLVLLFTVVCSLLLLESKFSSIIFNHHKTRFTKTFPPTDFKKDEPSELRNSAFSTFDYEQATRQESALHNEYDLTALLLHWKRFDGLRKTLQQLLRSNLFKEIIVWNNNPQVNLTLERLTGRNHSDTKLIRIINSKRNLKDEAKYQACTLATTRACFYVDDDFNVGHYLKCLIASFRSDPNLLHAVTDAYTFYTNLIWSYFDSTIDLHSGFSWIGCGSIFLRQHAQHHLQLMHKYLQNRTELFGFSDVFFSIWLNNMPVQMNTVLRQQSSRSSTSSISFSSTANFSHLQRTSSILAIRILEQSLRSDRSNKDNLTFSRQKIRRFPTYVKSPSLNDDFIFYTNILSFEFENISFNISQDFPRGTRSNLPGHPNVRYFQNHGTLKAVDGDHATCWCAHREIRSNDFYAIDFLAIQETVLFTVAVAHKTRLQAELDVEISLDGLVWTSYESTNGIYRKTNRTFEQHLYTYLFDSKGFDVGYRSFRYISFKARQESDERFQICIIIGNMINNDRRRILFIFFAAVLIWILYYHFSRNISSLLINIKILAVFSPSKNLNSASFTCPIQGDKWIVITTIFYPSAAVHKFLELKSPWNLVVIGDRKTPADWLSHVKGNRSRLLYLSIDDQSSLDYSILRYIPQGSYARKNIGYLVAIKCGAKIIFESDDDNLLETNDIYHLPKIVQPKHVPWISFHGERSPFINIYGSFGHPHIWPRGFPIDELKNVTEDGWHSVRKNFQPNTPVYIQQYLADLDPDVDALYRLTHPLTIGKIKFDKRQPPIALQPYTYSPYNTQNTITYYEAFWGLYLPITTTFRVCDIWRSYWVQRLLWDIGGQLMFGTSTIKQIRNSHSYLKDMIEEEQLYHQSGSFVRFLSAWSSSSSALAQRILQLAQAIADAGFWKFDETKIIQAWIDDLYSVGYTFPSIIPKTPVSPPSPPLQNKRAAICVTGVTECIQEAWTKNYQHIRNSLSGDADTFLYLSSSMSAGPVPLDIRLKQVRSYMNTTVTIIYEDQTIDPKIPADCQPNFILPKHVYKVDAYFQQVWALAQCYHLVERYQKQFNIKYQLLIRSRVDILSPKQFTLERDGLFNINTTILAPPNRFFNELDDGFAVGPMELMYHYMTRWYSFTKCPPDGIYHSETYLTRYLKRFTNVTRDRTLPAAADALRHGRDFCH